MLEFNWMTLLFLLVEDGILTDGLDEKEWLKRLTPITEVLSAFRADGLITKPKRGDYRMSRETLREFKAQVANAMHHAGLLAA